MSVLLLKVVHSIATFSCFSAPEVSGEHFVNSNENLIPDNETKNSQFGAFIFVLKSKTVNRQSGKIKVSKVYIPSDLSAIPSFTLQFDCCR